ncbi:MAG TPA: DNA primase DnaG [Candidatus Nanoarchaeia archaeon]|nr:DNA primase DnaG [Candidatus Nanoarchaeia archaeon]
MGKISPVSSKYIIHSNIDIEGVVDKPDVIGAIFGQTEGLLGADLELRELQKSGRIGRIEVNTETRSGKTKGTIIIPSSLDKAETSIVGAALEIIQRIGPCNAKIEVTNIEDVRISKRSMVIERAKELLRKMMENTMPDSQELADEVTSAVRVMEIVEYGRERLPAGPAIEESDEIIVVEGRADVLNLLKHGFKNAVAINGTSVPESIVELCSRKVVTAFVDGDRGGNLIIKELTGVADIDFVTKAPDGKEVEELAKKEIHKALRSRISGEQAKLELSKEPEKMAMEMVRRPQQHSQPPPHHMQQQPHGQQPYQQRPQRPFQQQMAAPPPMVKKAISVEEKSKFKSMLEDLIGTRGAEILDSKLAILGKVPVSEIHTALKSITNAHAVIFDGSIEREIATAAESANVKFLVAMDSKVKPNETRVSILTVNDF